MPITGQYNNSFNIKVHKKKKKKKKERNEKEKKKKKKNLLLVQVLWKIKGEKKNQGPVTMYCQW